tara:strand:- start:215 stop:382 length:168 start_codon:yes stop_codon:yes gene_type:complete
MKKKHTELPDSNILETVNGKMLVAKADGLTKKENQINQAGRGENTKMENSSAMME